MSKYTHSQALDVMVSAHQPEEATLRKYVIGFVASLIMTFSAYLLTRYASLSTTVLVLVLAVLALSQFVLQLIYFLHVGKEFSPRLKLLVTIFMVTIVFILVAGSIWIMNNLSGRMMTKSNMVKYMNSQDGL